jgi:hypothetical protein
MSDEEVIRNIRSQTLVLIETLTAHPKPTYSIDGQTVDWGQYLARLQATVAWCDRQLQADNPFEIHSQGYT